MKSTMDKEPDFRTASAEWADLPNIWTPIGWREHMFRFNVLWNGTLLAKPDLNRRTEPWKGQGIQLEVVPQYTSPYNDWHPYLRHDDGQVLQGWSDDDAPVLWTEWAKDGLILREYVFAHVPGGGEVQTGTEPLFAWLRLTVHALCPALPLEARHGFSLQIHAPHLSAGMSTRDNIHFDPASSRYPRPLKPECKEYSPAKGLVVLESDGQVRLAVAPADGQVTAEWFEPAPTDPRPAFRLYLQMPARPGAHVDVLLPFLPSDRTVLEKELALGYDGALRQSRAYWRRITACSTRFEVPEPDINDTIRHSVRFSNVLSEHNPETHKLCKINGSWVYADLWTTPGAMDLTMLMDLLGHHKTVERYLEIFREEQGTVKPPGDSYDLHPGYLSTPARYKSIDWLSDNGAVLWILCMHYLLSGDRAFLERFLDCILKSCEWIRQARAKTGHGGYEGVLPPAVATDAGTRIQAVWTIGWNFKALCAAVRVLKEVGHPRAEEFAAEAEAYHQDFLKALRHKCRTMPTWKDRRGRRRRLVPTALAGDAKEESRHAFYLDGGPLFLVFAGLLPAHDPLMKDTLAWFREGPPTRFYRRDSNCWQVPVLDREMSSCEPCYSWNVFHSWQAGDRERFLECLYSLAAGALSRKTRISCETRGGITGNVFASPLVVYLARLAVVDDQFLPGELHLLRLMPRAWLKAGDACTFENLPTEFGPVTLRTRVGKNGTELKVVYQPGFRRPPVRTLLHVPPGIRKVTVNGKACPARAGRILL